MPAGTISAIQAQASDAQRVNLFINGAFALGVSLNTLARERLYVGQQLSEEDFARLEQAEQHDRAISAALEAIEARPRSIAELRQRLQRRGFAPDAIDSAVERLAQLGLADDVQFARFWVESRQRSRPRGAGALRDELRRKGVAGAVISDTLSDDELVGDAQAQVEQIARAALRKYLSAPDYTTFQRRLGGFLLRRGFSPAVVHPLIARLWREHGRSEDEET
jgi:regulatory protein